MLYSAQSVLTTMHQSTNTIVTYSYSCESVVTPPVLMAINEHILAGHQHTNISDWQDNTVILQIYNYIPWLDNSYCILLFSCLAMYLLELYYPLQRICHCAIKTNMVSLFVSCLLLKNSPRYFYHKCLKNIGILIPILWNMSI